MKFWVIYLAKIDDDKHAGMYKIGDTEFTPSRPVTSYLPNDEELRKAAMARIKGWNGTLAGGAQLEYCDILTRFNETQQMQDTYRDHEVHHILQRLGYPSVDFDSTLDSGREWFKVDLETVKVSIKATKEWRDYVDSSELPPQEIYTLREEQQTAVDETHTRYQKAGDMLWHAKMRFGKTITALNLVKKEGYKRTIIITHRPVVEDSWGHDFYHVFSKEDKYVFLTKIHDTTVSFSDDETDEAIDKANDARLQSFIDKDLNFIYFASIQDLRGSKIVKGKFDKNRVVFDTHWDLVIIDEAHEGTKTTLGQAVIDHLISKDTKRLDLSGTAYNLLEKYTQKGSVFTWDYVMEQDRKANWPRLHPGEPNPYADMPQMHINTFDLEKVMKEKGLTLGDKSFTFREFFRTWTGDLSRDRSVMPEGCREGDFVHKDHVLAFLDLLAKDDESNRFPYATQEGCNQNIHSLWMVPGVKEAAALSALLQEHTFFGNGNFGIANVAGEGDHDEETHFSNALTYVRKKIEQNPCTITLSCGRLTTGVTVKEWTSVFMLSGSDETDAKQYMQTIFRVQSAGKIDGKQKTDCYVYDFAPDRALMVISDVAGSRRTKRGGTVITTEEQYAAFDEFLTYCPVIAIDGAEFKPFGVQDLISQINRVHIDRAFKTGFMDNCVYDMAKIQAVTGKQIDTLNEIFSKLKETKRKPPLKRAGLGKNGLGRRQKGKPPINPPQPPHKGDDQQKLTKELTEKLSTISIRLPLLFYGGDFDIQEGRLADIVDQISNDSWETFMPSNFTKADFRNLVVFYNQETIIGTGKAIREKAKEADLLPPTERTIAIAEIFSHFHNPSHETVLTPWRIVNLHMATDLGGYCFYNEKFEEHDEEYYKRLQEPRYVEYDHITEATLTNPDACILEINSKSGMYPLYVAYSLYRAKLREIGKTESECLPNKLQKIWNDAVAQIYVICQSELSVQITKRTLCGYAASCANLRVEKKLAWTLRDARDKFVKKILKASYWREGAVGQMKFDAVVGNPPYQEETANWNSTQNGQVRSKNIFHYFQMGADAVSNGYVSLIYPGGRWIHRSGKQMDEFGRNQINDARLVKIDYYIDAKEIFTSVDIGDGISIVFKNVHKNDPIFEYVYHEGDRVISTQMECPGDELITLNPLDAGIVKKVNSYVVEHRCSWVHDRILSQKLFGIESNFVELNPNSVRLYTDDDDVDFAKEIKILTNDKAGKAGRAKWYVVDRSLIQTATEYISKWKVIVSSANAGGQKRDSAMSIADNHSAFGRVRVGIGTFDTEEEAKNFFLYCKSKLIRFMFLMTDEALTSLAKKVPDIGDYSNDNGVIDFSKDIDDQLFSIFGLDEEDIKYIEERLSLHEGDAASITDEDETATEE